MKKVQKPAVWSALALLVLTVGCDGPHHVDETDDGYDAERFGSPYGIETNEAPVAPYEPPVIVGDTLVVMVTYAGGCAEHAFELASSTGNEGTRVWLRHDDGGDDCEALVRDRLRIPLPGHVLGSSRIHLLNPNEDIPFILRWNGGETS
ncbi:MAG: hypothetical protein WD021_08470 [Rhodothermales bacterium]